VGSILALLALPVLIALVGSTVTAILVVVAAILFVVKMSKKPKTQALTVVK